MIEYGTDWQPARGLRWLDRLVHWYLMRRSRYGTYVGTRGRGLDLECPRILWRAVGGTT